VFAPGFDNPEWHNGFEHDPEEAARVRIRLLRELAATGESMVATHLPFPSVCRVKSAGDVFRCVPTALITDNLMGSAVAPQWNTRSNHSFSHQPPPASGVMDE
jgi:hypothetical protein